ncbi:MAG: N-acetylmuramoyl-L-alanine amidase [Candidatus Gastranaerophilales bacterium]|nr:N-acetylmuramoyl-L-alanine amidase [Candidatus Gastranaerophilales bacterium]
MNFDTSNSLIFLTSPDNTTEAIMKNVKLTKLQNPNRVYFDINSAVLTTASQSWYFSNGVKQVKVSQFSTNPNKVRIVLYLDENFDQSKIKFLRVNNNIVIQFKDGMCQNEYFRTTYRDEKSSSSDFYENLSITSDDISKVKTVVSPDNTLNQIQQAFDANKTIPSNIQPVSNKSADIIKKELRLKSKYYLDLISPKSNGFLLSGFGVAGIEKPMYLTEPARVVFDIPNSIINPDIANKELKIGQDTLKAAQFDSKRVRIVITSNQLEKYFPVFSSDGQSVLFVNSEDTDFSLFNNTTDAVSYHVKTETPNAKEFTIGFNSPVVHSVRRDSSKLTINFYNALRYNDKTFKETVNNTGLEDMKIDLLPKVGLKLTLPLEKDFVVSSYMGADGKTIRIIVKGIKPKAKVCIRPPGKNSVVLDAGHGGSDYGAIKSGINEKDINLDLAKRVQAILQSKGVTVYMIRNSDETVSLEERTNFTEEKNPQIFVSIHVNSSVKPQITGLETHYYHQESLELAQTVHASLVSHIKSPDRGLFKSRFYVINHTTVPAILVETGFLSNDGERTDLLTEKRKQQTAKAIAEGILNYIKR